MNLAALVAGVLTLAVGGGSSPARLATFAGAWVGHTRGLTITRSGHAREVVSDGCCDVVLAMTFRLSHVRGTADSASATATVTGVRIGDRRWFTTRYPAPHVGESRRITLRAGVIDETLTGSNYCGPRTKHWVCGA